MPLQNKWLRPEYLFLLGFALAIPVSSLLQGDLKQRFRDYIRNPVVAGFLLFFLMVAASGFYSKDTPMYLERLRIKLPLAFLPFAVLSFPVIPKRSYQSLLYFLFLMMLGYAIYCTVLLVADFSAIANEYSRAGVLPMLISHIRISLLVAICVIIGAYLYRQGFYWFHPAEKYLQVLGTVFFFVFLHLIAVRSGLVAMYLILTAFAIRYIIISKRYYLGFAFIAMLIVLPIVAFYTIPTFKNKVNYMKFDVGRFLIGEHGGLYSDTRRLTSIQMGIKVGNAHPFTGVGYGDVVDANKAMYAVYYPNVDARDYFSPHNQFVYVYAGLGIPGLLIFMIAVLIPVFYRSAWNDPIALTINIAILSSFLTEHTIETQIGTAVYLLLLLPALQQLDTRGKTQDTKAK